MASRDPVIVYEHDVYALTAKGGRELRAAETSLSPAEIEVLVLTDGSATVAQVRASARSVAQDVVIATFEKLLGGGWIATASARKKDPLDLGDFFSAEPPASLSQGTTPQGQAEAAAGVTSLQKQGYFVRIAHRAAVSRTLAPGERLSAIVVEDELILAKFLRQYLALEGFAVRIASNRSEILAEFRRPPDLVLLDVMLPDADGFDVLQKMRQHPVLKSVPVIMLTAKATREAVLKGLAGGADGYVTKPFEAEALVTAVRAVLGLSGAPQPKKS